MKKIMVFYGNIPDTRSGEVETRRSRRLVISSIVTGNYEYGFLVFLSRWWNRVRN